MKATRFIGVLLGSAAMAAAAIVAFNAWIDPYLLFGRPRVAGFNALKPAVETREALMKAYQAARIEAPRTVVLGSSRSDIGLDPAHAAWPSAMQPVYNLSLAGSWLGVNVRYLRGLLALRPASARPDTLVVAIDFETFLFRPDAPPPTAASRAANAAFHAGQSFSLCLVARLRGDRSARSKNLCETIRRGGKHGAMPGGSTR